MKRSSILTVAAGIALFGTIVFVHAGMPEMFDNGLNGWTAYDLVNERNAGSIAAVDETLRLRYAPQSIPMPPEAHVLRADNSASGGAFAGNYIEKNVCGIRVRINPADGMQIDLLLQNDDTHRRWRYEIEDLTPGTWNTVTVPVSVDSLAPINSSPDQYVEDLNSISWMGILVVRGSDMAEQLCYVDDVRTIEPDDEYLGDMEETIAASGWRVEMLPDEDLDGDGMKNEAEWIAGTDVENGEDLLTITEVSQETNGVRIRWKAAPGRIYRVVRSFTPGGERVPVSEEITATETECDFTDETAPEDRTSFYKVEVRRP